ncbi:MAG: GON domain-containing protein [Kofleriaceae bacterium]
MNKLSSIAFTSLLVTAAAACGDVVQPEDSVNLGEVVEIDTSGQPAKIIAASCADMRAQDPSAGDDDYTLYVGGDEAKPFTAWCEDMAGTPRDYLKLHNVDGDYNFSQYTMGGASNGFDVRTSYFYLRFNPETLEVDTSDQTFALSTQGALNHPGGVVVTSMPYGVAMGCGGTAVKGLANIDLGGTGFAVADSFQFVGNFSWGVIAANAEMTSIDVEGGGDCGWMAPVNTAFDPMNSAGGTLALTYAR